MRLLPSHRALVCAVSDCRRICEAAGIGAILAAGMRLSRSFALPSPPPARKTGPWACAPGSVCQHSARCNASLCLSARETQALPQYAVALATSNLLILAAMNVLFP